MQTVYYKRGEMIGQAFGCLILAAGSVWLAINFHGSFRFLGMFLAVTLPFAALGLFVRAAGDGVALRFDNSSLTVNTLWGGSTVPWSHVVSIHRETLRHSAMFGLVKRDVGFYLVVTVVNGGLTGNRFKVNERLLDWPISAMPALLADLARLGRLDRTADAPRPLALTPVLGKSRDPLEGDRSTDFDADAIMARYLAGRAETPVTSPSTPASRPGPAQFGRRWR